MLTTAIYTRPARPNDRHKLDRFLSAARQVHNHLDWQPPQAWLGQQPFHLAFVGDTMVGVFAAPPDPPDASWVRLAAVEGEASSGPVLDALWMAAYQTLSELKVLQVTCMLLEVWLRPHLERWGFGPLVDVVVLRRPRLARLGTQSLPDPATLRLRPATPDDLTPMASVDNAAFAPPWQYSPAVLRQAMMQSTLVTVAELEGQIVGYQISSGGREGAHLARLAVIPGLQGRGIGRRLTVHMLDYFEKRGAPKVTVNTQRDNAASLKVYHDLGFELTGEYYVVLQHKLSP
jgi:ribosomal protein S18 acetylase RimI-like enzyme